MGLWSGIALLGWLLFMAGKKYISIPRMGRATPGPAGKARRRKVTRFMIVTFVFTVAAVVVTILFGSSRQAGAIGVALGEWAMPAFVALFLVLLFGVLGYFLAYERMALIGLLFALPWLVVEAVDQRVGIDVSAPAFLVASGIVILMGLITFVRFLQKNPLPANDALSNAE
jgi:hypothetical protein